MMKKIFFLAIFVLLNHIAQAKQTIIFIRHSEKPSNKSGQLTCQGLNRALALPNVLINRYGRPDAIFAAAPEGDKLGDSQRSVTTITPTAIRLSMPIILRYHAQDTNEVIQDLLQPQRDNTTIFVVWEHKKLVDIARKIVQQQGASPKIIPKWHGDDYDSIYIVTINRQSALQKIIFSHEHEGLNNRATICP